MKIQPKVHIPKSMLSSKICPKSEYKGPILQLTESDKVEIEVLKARIESLKFKINDIKGQIRLKGRENKIDYNLDRIEALNQEIDNLNSQIKAVKVNRINIQRAAEKSSDTNLDVIG
jgi:hypothetical protein